MSLILGCNAVGHDSTFAFVRDGKLLYSLEEERFNRYKHSFSFSTEGLLWGMRKLGISLEDIDYAANFMDASLLKEIPSNALDEEDRKEDMVAFDSILKQYPLKLSTIFPVEKIINVPHHMAHCAGAFYPSYFKEAAILSIDGRGESVTSVIAHGKDESIGVLKKIFYPHSLGHFYDAITYWLGWGFGEEGKTMALSAYGKPLYYQRIRDELIDIEDDGTFRMKKSFWHDKRFKEMASMFGPSRKKNDEITVFHKDIAASAQLITEEITLKLSRTAKSLTGSNNLIICGGVALNSVANGKIAKEKIFNNISVYPHSSDIGTAIGAAMYVYYKRANTKRQNYWIFEHPYHGAEIDIENIEDNIKEYGLRYQRHINITGKTAELLMQNKIVGWVQGRAEIGPRALGNRSILANPLNPDMKDIVNKKVKFREEWRPFAPSVTEESCGKYFNTAVPSPYMTIVADLKEEWREKLLAISHIDGTARIQTVNERQNPLYYRLLREFESLSGVGMLLNTSFNVSGEPIVQTCRQAIDDFLRTDMDVLVIDDYVFEDKYAEKRFLPFSTLYETFYSKLKKFKKIMCSSPAEAENDMLLAKCKEIADYFGSEFRYCSLGEIYADAKKCDAAVILLNRNFQYYTGFGARNELKSLLAVLNYDNSYPLLFMDNRGLLAEFGDIAFILNAEWE